MTDERILVVDDEPHVAQLCGLTLSAKGYRVQAVHSGQTAINHLEAESFDLLIVDMKMPDVDGLTVLRRARELDPNLATVVITGYATMDRTIEALRAGARGFLLKPFGAHELGAEVKAALDQREREEERLRLKTQVPILEISQALMTEGNVQTLARQLLEIVSRQVDAPCALLLLWDDAAGESRIASALGLPDEQQAEARHALTDQMDRIASSSEKPWVLDARSAAVPGATWQALFARPDLTSLLFVPLPTANKAVGMLCLGRDVVFTQSERNLMAIVGRQMAIALENAQMYATEQQHAAELTRALKQQQELDRLKNEFIQNVSHELRTPLALLVSYAEMLVSGELGKVQKEQREPLDTIWQCAQTLQNLVDNITALLDNQSQELPWEPVLLSELVREILAALQPQAREAGLVLRGDPLEKTPPVLGSGYHLHKVVSNLLINALKFTPPGGQITVSLRHSAERVILQVADTGVGIAAEDQEHIFERFYQVNGSMRRRYGGSGLGLSLVKEIVEAHGGTVAVESRPGQGSTFQVSLPAARDDGESPNEWTAD